MRQRKTEGHICVLLTSAGKQYALIKGEIPCDISKGNKYIIVLCQMSMKNRTSREMIKVYEVLSKDSSILT